MAAPLPPPAALIRFQENELRMDRFANGSDTETWTTRDGEEVPSIRKFLADNESLTRYASSSVGSVAEFAESLFISSVKSVWVQGYYSPGDGGAHLKVKLASIPSPVEPWHTQSADGAWWELKAVIPLPEMFGAKGDGIADDTAALRAVIRLGRLDGTRVYRFIDTLQLGKICHSKGIRLLADFTNPMTVQRRAINRPKSVQRTISMTAALAYKASSVVLADVTGITVDTLLHFRSDAVWASDGEQDVFQGQLVRVIGVSGTTVTFSPALDDDYVSPFYIDVLDAGNDIDLEGVELRTTAPLGNVLSGIWMGGCLGLRISGADVQGFGRDGIALETCFQADIEANVRDATETSTGYAVTLYSSNQSVNVKVNTDHSRTGITLGGAIGANRSTTITGNFTGCFTSAVNTKVAAKGVTVNGANCEGRDGGGLGDGIRLRGTDISVSGGTVRNFNRYPVILSLYGKTTKEKIRSALNGVICPDAKNVIVLQAGGAGTVGSIVAIGNTITFQDGITSASVGALNVRGASAKLDSVVLMGNVADNCPFHGIDVRGVSGTPIDKLVSVGNILNLNAVATSAGRLQETRSFVTTFVSSNI